MTTKPQQLQIRVTPNEESAIRRLARAAGLDVSSHVLARSLPATQGRFDSLLRALAEPRGRSYVLAELNDFLSALSAPELAEGVGLVEGTAAVPEHHERRPGARDRDAVCRGGPPDAGLVHDHP